MNKSWAVVIFLTRFVGAEPAAIDAIRFNATEEGIGQLQENTTTVHIPASSLKQTGDGGLMLALPGDEEGGSDRKKPRAFFMDENLLGLAEGEGLFDEILASIRRAVDEPMSRVEIRRQQERLDELARVVSAFRQEQKRRVEFARELHFNVEPFERFEHHPGYQEQHSARLESGGNFSVPGVIEAPISGKKGHGAGTSQGTGASPLSLKATATTAATCYQQGKRRYSEKRPPPKKPAGIEKKVPKDGENGLTVDTEVSVDGGKYTVFCSLNDDTQDLYCAICANVSNEQALECQECGNHICKSHLESLRDKDKCPTCNNSAKWQSALLKRRLARLQWRCPGGCGLTKTLSEMTDHIRRCKYVEDEEECYFCEYNGCSFSGSYYVVAGHEKSCDLAIEVCGFTGCQATVQRKNLKSHMNECQWKPVPFGGGSVPLWEIDFFQSVAEETPAEYGPGREYSAGVAVARLLKVICSMPAVMEEVSKEMPTGSEKMLVTQGDKDAEVGSYTKTECSGSKAGLDWEAALEPFERLKCPSQKYFEGMLVDTQEEGVNVTVYLTKDGKVAYIYVNSEGLRTGEMIDIGTVHLYKKELMVSLKILLNNYGTYVVIPKVVKNVGAHPLFCRLDCLDTSGQLLCSYQGTSLTSAGYPYRDSAPVVSDKFEWTILRLKMLQEKPR